MSDADLEEWFIGEPVKIGRRLQTLFASDSSGLCSMKRNNFVLVPGDENERVGQGLWRYHFCLD